MVRTSPLLRLSFALASISMIFGASGCRTGTLRSDQAQIREAVLGLYEDQVMDNLIRTKLQLPLVQISYSNLSGTVTTTAKGTLGGTNEDTDNTFGAAGGGSTPTDVSKDVRTLSLEGTKQVSLNLKGDPVHDTGVYDRYVKYIAFDDGRHFVESKDDPAEELVHGGLKREFRHRWYYVPAASGKEFFSMFREATYGKGTKAPSDFESIHNALELLRLNQNL